METLLKWLNLRVFAAAAFLAVFASIAYDFYAHPPRQYLNWRYPPQTQKSTLASDIERDLAAREDLSLKALHRQVSQEIAQARSAGFNVSALQRAADSALLRSPLVPSRVAVERLQKLRLTIPRKPDPLRVAPDNDDENDDARPASKKARRARKRSR